MKVSNFAAVLNVLQLYHAMHDFGVLTRNKDCLKIKFRFFFLQEEQIYSYFGMLDIFTLHKVNLPTLTIGRMH
jgi:hypothetical protein